jgi:hypothetical protein
MRLSALIAVLVALAVVAAPAAAAPSTPAAPPAKALKKLGLRITWPAAPSAPVAAGTRYVVRVTRLSHRARKVSLVWASVKPNGQTIRRLASARLSHGRFVATVPSSGGTFRLRLVAGGHAYRFTVVGAKSVSSGGGRPCPTTGRAAATITPNRTTVSAGQSITYTVRNTGTTCLIGGYGGSWERSAGFGWVPVPDMRPVPTIAFLLSPGASRTLEVTPPPAAGRGTYRFTSHWARDLGPTQSGVGVSFTFFYDLPAAPCEDPGTVSGTLTAAQVSGTTIRIGVTNTGQECLDGGLWVGFERLVDGVWQTVPDSRPIADLGITIEPGRTWTRDTTLPDGSPSGHYRAIKHLSGEAYDSDVVRPITLSGEFDYVAPPVR